MKKSRLLGAVCTHLLTFFSRLRLLWGLPILFVGWTGATNATTVTNGSFETGDFSGWVTQDLTDPFFPLSVQTLGAANTFDWPWSSTPTDGNFTAFHGFDGAGTLGPNPIRVAQDITVTADQTRIDFDYRGAWDLLEFGAAQNRIFDVNIEVAGGGANLANFNILTAVAGTAVDDTGQLSGWVDLSPFAGQTVHLAFDWFVPENYTGPAQFQLDNVHAVPIPAAAWLFGSGLLGLIGIARRKKTA